MTLQEALDVVFEALDNGDPRVATMLERDGMTVSEFISRIDTAALASAARDGAGTDGGAK